MSSITEIDWDGDPGTTYLTNCTFFDSETYVLWIENPGDVVYMYNCILAGGDNICLAFELLGTANYHGDYNIFHTDDGSRVVAVGYTDEFSLTEVEAGDWTTYSGQDAHSLVVYDPETLFVSPSGYDLHLTSTSPAIDRGTSTGAPSEDFEGNPRPYGAGYDIGAYEYTPGGAINEERNKPEAFEIVAYPNPFNGMVIIKTEGHSGLGIPKVAIYDISGKVIEELIPSHCASGMGDRWKFIWSPKPANPTGLYLIRASYKKSATYKKVIYIK